MILLLLTLFMSGEVFSQSSRSKKSKERPVKVEENANQEASLGKARIDTKDGATFLGDYIEETDESITIKIVSDDIITIDKSKVKRAKTPLNAIVLNQGKFHNTTGMFLHYSTGFNAGQQGGGFMGDIGLGYRFNKNWELITGIGFMGTNVNVFPTQNFFGEYKTFFPAYAGAKYNLTHGGVRVFGLAKAGFSSTSTIQSNPVFWRQDELSLSSGVYFEPGIGVSFASRRIGQTSITLSQIIQRSNFELNTTDRFANIVTGTGKIWISRIGIKLTTTVF